MELSVVTERMVQEASDIITVFREMDSRIKRETPPNSPDGTPWPPTIYARAVDSIKTLLSVAMQLDLAYDTLDGAIDYDHDHDMFKVNHDGSVEEAERLVNELRDKIQ